MLYNLSYKRRLYNPVKIIFESQFCFINGYLTNIKLVYKLKQIYFLKKGYILIHKKYIRCFFRLLWMHLDSVCIGYKTTIYVKGKGLRFQLKTRKGNLCIYLKLGYSHKIFLHLPKNCWVKIFGRRRTIRLYALNYILLRNLALKIRSFYPMGLYKVRGFFIEKEKFKIIEGKSRLGSGSGYYG